MIDPEVKSNSEATSRIQKILSTLRPQKGSLTPPYLILCPSVDIEPKDALHLGQGPAEHWPELC